MRRRFADKRDVDYIVDKEFKMIFIDDHDFKGHMTYIKMNKVSAPMIVGASDYKLCLLDDGYVWMQHFPTGEEYCLLTMMDANLNVVQWYYDIIKPYQLTEDGVPSYDDMYLDVAVLSTGEVLTFDEDELEEALVNNFITKEDFDRATVAGINLKKEIKESDHKLAKISQDHLFKYFV